jgi:hypothetical protein
LVSSSLPVAICIVFLTASSRADAIQRYKPPAGYAWQEVQEMGCAFLKPKGWHYKHVERDGQHARFISRDEGSFQTGLTVNMILLSHLKTGITAFEYAKQFMYTATRQREPLQSLSTKQGPFRAYGSIILDDSRRTPILVHNLVIANDRSGTIYVVLYEAPEGEWREAW